MNGKTNVEAAPAIDGAFLAMLQQHRRGEALSDLSDALREVTEAVRATGKAGAVQLNIKVKPAAKGGAMVVEDVVKTVLPKEEREGSIFFADDSGNLLREDPKQTKLPLRTVEASGQTEEQPLRKAVAS